MNKIIVIAILTSGLLVSCTSSRINLGDTNIVKIEESAANNLDMSTMVFQEDDNLIVLGSLRTPSLLNTSIPGHVHLVIKSPQGEELCSLITKVKVNHSVRRSLSRSSLFRFELPIIVPAGSLVSVKYDTEKH